MKKINNKKTTVFAEGQPIVPSTLTDKSPGKFFSFGDLNALL
jgi:hypothetical protein